MGHEHLVSVVFIENRFLASMVPVSRSFPNLHHNKSAKFGWFANLTRHNIFCDLDDSLIISQIIFLKLFFSHYLRAIKSTINPRVVRVVDARY